MMPNQPQRIYLFEDRDVAHLRPLAVLRPAMQLRRGRTLQGAFIADQLSYSDVAWWVREDLVDCTREANPGRLVNVVPTQPVWWINGRLAYVPSALKAVMASGSTLGKYPSTLVVDPAAGALVAAYGVQPPAAKGIGGQGSSSVGEDGDTRTIEIEAQWLRYPWDLVATLPESLTQSCSVEDSSPVPQQAYHKGISSLYLAPSVLVDPGVVFNTSGGPIYVDEGAVLGAHSVINGPCYIGPHAQVRPHTQVSCAAIGFGSRIGGEVSVAVLGRYVNKVHYGFLGHSYIDSWCNLGAGTTTSNLRNDYGFIKMRMHEGRRSTGLQFLGTMMGPYAKCSIGTTLNTGTLVGAVCNLFDHGFHPADVGPFSWGSPTGGYVRYQLDRALEAIERTMARRDEALSDADRNRLTALYQLG